MAGLRYVGAPVADDPDLVYQDYVRLLKDEDLTTEQIDAVIDSGLGSYATRSYVEQQDALLASSEYINAQDNLRVKLASKDVPNGVAALDATGKVSPNRINAPNSQRYLKGPWVPSAYMGAVDSIAAGTTLFTLPVADPGYPYRLLVFGEIDGHINTDTEHLGITVNVGSPSGPVVALGRGAQDAQENALAGDDFNRANSSNIGAGWDYEYGSGTGSLTISGNAAAWADGGAEWRTVTARRVDPNSAKTATNIQRVLATIDTAGETELSGQGKPYLRLFTRVNDAGTQYCAWEHTDTNLRFVYNAGAGEQQLGTTVASGNMGGGTQAIAFAGNPAGEARKFYFYKGTTLIHQVEDTAAVTAMGPNNRGWGFGMRATSRNFGQTTPPSLDSIYVTDALPNHAQISILPYNLTGGALTGATTLYVQAGRSGTVALGSVRAYRPRLHVMAVPA
ncbi:hypothetical protein MYRNA_240 [Mycobacterium phage Myrna]|uniref:DUF7257 domain-containing protein n=1 Tax=Mycobacterium phage Myrna TaxID=546805 RepID=B5LJL0_9CAUD|nr:gp240 [Mycobacterium phage Myrna]ACH62207.1 hypothetical protein MYRNA_240 [Mycobacterium phage Myrna]